MGRPESGRKGDDSNNSRTLNSRFAILEGLTEEGPNLEDVVAKLKQQISELAGPSVVLPPSPVQSKGESSKKRNGKNRANPESTTG